MKSVEERLDGIETWIRIFITWALVLSINFLLAAVGHCQEPGIPIKNELVRVWLSPVAGVSGVQPTVHIISYDPDLTCPAVEIIWAEDITGLMVRSFRESDCDPEDLPESFFWERVSPIKYPEGSWTIKVTLKQSVKKFAVSLIIEVV